MATPPNPGDVANQMAALNRRGDTPGLNSFGDAWRSLDDFCGNWANGTFGNMVYIAALIGGTAQ